MVLATELNVYKTTYDLTLATFHVIKGFSREYKYTLGETIKRELLELAVLIYRANVSRHHRGDILTVSRERMEALRLLFRLAHDLKTIPLTHFVTLSESIESISKQLTAWEKSSAR
ncbi:MAG: four helix bundle protein [Candidatus Gracilibacteria bacterium]|nr:four helix bundle protein [Candidatus Gracilibacteria bacterium]